MSVDLAMKLQAIGRPRILVVGDFIHDYDYHCESNRFAQEAPHCIVLKAPRLEHEQRAGGAGAVTAMARALGADATGIYNLTNASARKDRYFVNGVQVMRIDRDAELLTANRELDMLAAIQREVQSADCVLIADYGKGAGTDAVLRTAIDGARKRGVLCIVDPAHGRHWDAYKGAACIKCNRPEMEAWRFGSGNMAYPTVELICRWSDLVIISEGKEGLRLCMPAPRYHEDDDFKLFTGRSRNAIDPTGAGDCVLTALGVCIAGGMNWSDACRVANAAAGLKVERRGAVPVSRAEVVLDMLDGEKRIPRELLPSVRAAHQRIVFTNGIFDLLGPHHLYLLENAKKHGDILVVGVNDDDSVKRLKGPKRPIWNLEERAVHLASLACVDYVVPFAEDTTLPLLELLRPNILVKADDPERNPAGDVLADEIVLIPMMPDLSTTHTVNRINRMVVT